MKSFKGLAASLPELPHGALAGGRRGGMPKEDKRRFVEIFEGIEDPGISVFATRMKDEGALEGPSPEPGTAAPGDVNPRVPRGRWVRRFLVLPYRMQFAIARSICPTQDLSRLTDEALAKLVLATAVEAGSVGLLEKKIKAYEKRLTRTVL